jgi:hypothetical protein
LIVLFLIQRFVTGLRTLPGGQILPRTISFSTACSSAFST